jgi:hypothetical protein
MKDLHSHLLASVAIGCAALAADNTPAAIDLKGYNAAEILISIGIGGITFSGTNKVEFKLTHSDDDSTYTAVADADMLGVTGITTGIIKSLIAAHAGRRRLSLRLQGREAVPEAARRLQRHPRHRHADRRHGAAGPRLQHAGSQPGLNATAGVGPPPLRPLPGGASSPPPGPF